MHPVAVMFLLVACAALWFLPRRWAPVPLLAGACYMTLGQGVEVMNFNFPIIRILFLAGIVRVLIRGERPAGGFILMDKLFLAWGAWALLVSIFRENPGSTLEFHLGMVYNGFCVYFLMRCFLQNYEDVRHVITMIAWILVPVALAMIGEQVMRQNVFAIFGGVPDEPVVRNERIRSQGPFAHAILAGTCGAVCIPMMVGLWRLQPFTAGIGLISCLLMVLASNSSGPLMSVIFSLLALAAWRWRHLTSYLWRAGLVMYLALEMVMKAPAYYLIARIDLTGSSASYHRAALIQAAIEHLHEWWWAGTDYTRHWLPYGVPWSEDHVDITNHYIGQGVKGGILLMGLFVALLWCGFHYVGRILRSQSVRSASQLFMVWSVGAGLFAHAASCVSVAYFDQSIVFLYLTLALVATLFVTVLGPGIANAVSADMSGTG